VKRRGAEQREQGRAIADEPAGREEEQD